MLGLGRFGESDEFVQRCGQLTGPERKLQNRKDNAVKRYEGLFILNLAGKEEGLGEAVDKLKTDISSAGGKVETIQKMDKKSFVRVTDKKVTAGHYVNVIFEGGPGVILAIQSKIKHTEEIYRALFTEAGKTPMVVQ